MDATDVGVTAWRPSTAVENFRRTRSAGGLLHRPWDKRQPKRRQMTQDSNEVAIRALLEAQAQAIQTKEVDGTLSPYGPDLVRYDLAPPLAPTGAEALDRHNLIAW